MVVSRLVMVTRAMVVAVTVTVAMTVAAAVDAGSAEPQPVATPACPKRTSSVTWVRAMVVEVVVGVHG
jgi:hypothetical protein